MGQDGELIRLFHYYKAELTRYIETQISGNPRFNVDETRGTMDMDIAQYPVARHLQLVHPIDTV